MTLSWRTPEFCEVGPRKDNRGVDLISDTLSFGPLWCGEPNAASYAEYFWPRAMLLIRVYVDAGNVIQTP